LHRAISYFHEGEYNDALLDLNMAVYLQPVQSTAYIYRGRVSAALERYAAAISDYTMALKYSPQAAHTYRLRGEAYEALGEPDAARRDFERCAALDLSMQRWINERIASLV
jgi:tetratricopeptide (TPR) repeat protein